MNQLRTKVAIITGGGSGIGAATAERIAEQGASVMITDINGSAAEQTARVIQQRGQAAQALAQDVADPDAWEKVFTETAKAFGPVNVLVNNAGTSQRGDFLEVSDKIWQDDLDLKLFSAVRLCRLVIPGMRSRKWGRIINVLNLGAKVPNGGGAPTAVSRAAGMALTKVLANENAGFNILVNGLLVGRIRSDQ